ncbi:TM2 domain-containing protein [Clostridium sp. CM028]|uniref:TM2 domain-containing protein n=1 Tax=unclassified Clostridium TaxID=2614128 RepID=UPI001C0B4100|nr:MULTISPECIES: TM2 domain-containing protein [unclassified Clostridium]MBU3091134.1 TM2 domain-containing protein [Clostridium sp. CF011]MBW9144884.1 TM2 domain-containing protein [Clostridium sp. CM027]MBW9148697.1 TM2 domain-containing protein [Clostridium sp. CM028]UVE40027.1 TM2 domain-containing protein [Clostridium sp. CM027]WAG68950.1 TM2 domain-containing protein [Clostridium sp. CF011]
MFCPSCGSQNEDSSNFCKICGINLLIQPNTTGERIISEKNWLVALLLCIFVGAFGIHRFYVGKIGTGILMILTFGGFGIWVLVDIILIATNSFKDINGLQLNKNMYRY